MSVIEELSKTITDYAFNRGFSDAIVKLYDEIKEKINCNSTVHKEEVLNFFFVNIYNSFKTFLMLVDEYIYTDSYIIGRRIIEILIRTEYIANNNKYEHYYREKYAEKAEMLFRLIKSHRIRDYVNTALWKERTQIIAENKKLWEEIHLAKTLTELPSIEGMAEDVGLTYLFKTKYSQWSKFTHCNMSTEASVRYFDGKELKYLFFGENSAQKKVAIRTVLSDVNYCMYLFAKKYCQELNVLSDRILKFEGDNVLVSFDLTTGRMQSSIDVGAKLLSGIIGEEYTPPTTGLEDVSITFLTSDPAVFKRNNDTLEKLVKDVENELKKTTTKKKE